MSLAKSILSIIGCYVISILVADIAGVLANSLFDIFAGRSKSQLLYYSVWFVLAIFSGMLYYSFANDCVKTSRALYENSWVIIIMAMVLSTLAILIFYAKGQMEEPDLYYVPGNPYMTYTFFITFILAALLARNLEIVERVKSKKNATK